MIKKINILGFIGIISLFSTMSFGQMRPPKPLKADNISAARQMHYLDSIMNLNAEEEDSETANPAEDLYEGAWSSTGVNANRVAYENVPDSVKFDCSSFIAPLNGQMITTSPFGARWGRYHYGTDIKLNIGDTVVSVFEGKVRVTSYDEGGYGNYIVVRHPNGLETVYGHLSEIKVLEGQTVRAGQCIALGGNTGRSTGPHLHFETRFLGNPINPEYLFDFSTGQPLAKNYLLQKDIAFGYVKELETIKKMAAERKAKAPKVHVVKKGETLSSIAKKRGTTVAALKKLNKKALGKGSKIKAGQRLKYT